MTVCASCNTNISEGSATLVQGKNKKSPLLSICASCVSKMEQAFQAETNEPNLWGGLTVGLGAALIASLAWYAVVVVTKLQLGIIAVAVGWLVGQAVMLGAGHKRGRQLQMLSVGITTLTMAFSEYLIVRYFVVEALRQQGYTDFQFLLPLDSMLSLIFSGLAEDPMTLLFWALALLQAWVLPAQRQLQRVNK